jgi:hypothetical protein
VNVQCLWIFYVMRPAQPMKVSCAGLLSGAWYGALRQCTVKVRVSGNSSIGKVALAAYFHRAHYNSPMALAAYFHRAHYNSPMALATYFHRAHFNSPMALATYFHRTHYNSPMALAAYFHRAHYNSPMALAAYFCRYPASRGISRAVQKVSECKCNYSSISLK